MRSISWKLLLAFLLVSISGTVLFFSIARNYSNQEIQNFLFDQDQSQILTRLIDHYDEHQSWADIHQVWKAWQPDSRPEGRGAPFALIDANGVIVQGIPGPGTLKTGNLLSGEDLDQAIPLESDGTVIGYLLFPPNVPREYFQESPVLERVNQLLILSAVGSILLALVLGVMLSRTLSRPLRELSTAAQRAATGDLSQKVEVNSKDEIGVLARSFNQMMEDLEGMIASRKQLTADIAHHLRTPISVILGHAEGVHEGVIEPTQETFGIIRDEALRLERLVKDLRLLSMAEVGELDLELSRVSSAKIIDEVEKTAVPLISERSISIQKELQSGLPKVLVDMDRILQVMRNILDNAVRYTPEGGEVRISAGLSEDGASVIFDILDGGPGVPHEELDKIFSRFYRTDPSRRRDQDGSGLGLAIARSITEQHGGKIWAESGTDGGLSVKLKLPCEKD